MVLGGVLPIAALALLTPASGIRTSRQNHTSVDAASSCASIGCGAAYDRNRPCQCNSQCSRYGNCCSDYKTLCESSSPADSCASIGCGRSYDKSRPCQCNDRCPSYGNCCSDFATLCQATTPSPTPSPSPSPSPSPPPGPPGVPSPAAAAYWEGVNLQSMSSVKSRVRTGTRTIGYSGLWTAYKTVWVNLPGQCQDSIYDIYSLKCWTPGTEQCGGYRGEGDCYNREHSWPKSWWSGAAESGTAYSDIFHVMPSDGYVNGRRSNHPFGNLYSTKYTSSEGHRVGPCNKGTCFEPTARTKGAVARAHFYVALRYGFTMKSDQEALVRWHEENPPQAWETEFNDRAQKEQGNRNPYIDHPSLVAQHFR